MAKIQGKGQGWTIYEILSSEEFTEDEKLSIKHEILLRAKEKWMFEPMLVSFILALFADRLIKLLRDNMESDNYVRSREIK